MPASLDSSTASSLRPLVRVSGVRSRDYLGSDLLMLGLGGYDLATRGKLHPAYIAGAVWTIALQCTAWVLLDNPTWKALSLHLIGH